MAGGTNGRLRSKIWRKVLNDSMTEKFSGVYFDDFDSTSLLSPIVAVSV